MTSDFGDSKDVSEDLEQCQFEAESTAKVKPSSQGLNPNADVFYSNSNPTDLGPLNSLSSNNNLVNPLEGGEDSLVKNESNEPKSEPMPEDSKPVPTMTEGIDKLHIDNTLQGQQPSNYECENNLSQDGGQACEEMPYEVRQQLKQALRIQLEYYFSRENLAKDTYLLSQMDSDQYVSISTIANFNQVRNLTRDINFIVEVLRESPNVQVDEAGEKVRPCHKRCVIILREIPESTPVKEIEELFKNEKCPNYVSCEFAHNNNWYINFETDEDAQLAFKYLREEVKTFQGKTIMARIKAKPSTRDSFLPPYKNGIRPPTPMDPNYQATQQRFVSTVSYGNNAQMLGAPFYPPTLLQAWGPSTGHQPYLDLGAVFTVNGLSPQATYKPIPNTGRLNFPMVRGRGSSANKHYGRQQQSYDMDHNRYDRNPSYIRQAPPPPQPSLLNGAAASGYGYMPYPYANSRSPYSFGLEMLDFWSTKRMEGHPPSLYPSYTPLHTSQSTAPSRTINSKTSENKEENFTKMSHSDNSKETFSSQPLRTNRNRRRKKEDGALNSNKLNENDAKTGDSPKFDLEPAAFPPLPGAEEADPDVEVRESRLSDVVKGTVRPADIKTTESVQKEACSNSADCHVLTPPPSPVICNKQQQQIPEATIAIKNSHQELCKVENSASPSKGRTVAIHPEESSGPCLETTLNGHNDCDSPNFSEDERLACRRLTYSEVAQKPKVEKIAQESKEGKQQRHQDSATVSTKPSKSSLKEFSKNRYADLRGKGKEQLSEAKGLIRQIAPSSQRFGENEPNAKPK